MCELQTSLLKHNNIRECPNVTAAHILYNGPVIQEINMLSLVLVLAICQIQFGHALVVEPKAVGDTNSEVNGNFLPLI